MQWLAQNWPWIVIVVVAGLFLFGRGRHYRLGAFGTPGGYGARWGDGDRAAPEDNGAHERGRGGSAIDPVSGKAVDTNGALTSFHAGRVYFFENHETRRRFEASPDRFANNARDAGLPPSTSRTDRARRRDGC